MKESGYKATGRAPCSRQRALRITAVLTILASACWLLTGCLPPQSPNVLPSARFSSTPTSGSSPLVVSFDASGSEDPDGVIQSYEWGFGDGVTGNGVFVSHTFTASATRGFVVTLTITDDQGGMSTANASITVTVSSPLPLPPPPSSEQYVASTKSEVFHRLNCSYVAQIEPENRIYFDTRAAAVGSGRRPCSRCSP